LKIGPLWFKKCSSGVGVAAATLGVSILTMVSVQVVPENYRAMLKKAGKGRRIVVVKDSTNPDTLQFQIENDSLKVRVKQEKEEGNMDGMYDH